MRAAVLLSLAVAGAVASSFIPPAATEVETPPEASVELFQEETRQVTDDVITDLQNNDDVGELAELFVFGEGEAAGERKRRMRRTLKCKTAPGDFLWPSTSTWKVFDLLLGGALEKVVPIASVCYPESEFDNYNAAKCAEVTNNWAVGETHTDHDSSVMWPAYIGNSCKPGTDPSALGNCTLGGYASYSVHVKNVAQIQLAVNFARSLNLRLAVKNTGHDYNGRSTGKHALSLWTHNLKEIKYIQDYKSKSYRGPVFKVGAGVQGSELYEAAEKYGVTAVAGICPSVGVFGGYVTGGGHSPVMQLHGMGADQVLEMQVVTADGRFLTVTEDHHPDLYWAMLGGGGGTYGILTSAVVKVHPKIDVTTSLWSFTSAAVGPVVFWEAVHFFWNEMPKYNAAKTYSFFGVFKLAPGFYLFDMAPFFATKMTVAQFEALTKPFFDKLQALGIPYDINTQYHRSFYPAYQATFANIDYQIGNDVSTPGNRILPAANWEDPATSNATFNAVKQSVDSALALFIYHQAPADIPIKNSVNPAFRNQASQIVAVHLPSDTTPAGLAGAIEDLTTNVMGPLRTVTPNGGAYGNEADIAEPNWQQAFWGNNYPRLLSIKQKYDPLGVFYGHHNVGSEGWYVEDGERGLQTQDGKLCRV